MRRQLERLEHADSAEIRRSQERRLRALVRVAAARSPFYREYFRESGVNPRCIRTLEDLPQLPLLTRDHLVERVDDFRVYPRRLLWAAHSSGTSGRPITSYRTPGSSVYELCALEQQWGWFGLRPGARRVILRGSDFAATEPGKLTKAVPGARQLLVSSFHLIPSNLDAIMQDVRAFEPDAIEGWPSSIALLAALLRERDEKFPVKAVITSSETMTAGRVALIEDVFSGPVIDHYGQTERVMMAGTCEHGGYHVFPDYGIVELLPVPNTESRWELVGTPLHNWGFPLFRYRTGDEVGPAPTQPCPCGRSFPLLGLVRWARRRFLHRRRRTADTVTKYGHRRPFGSAGGADNPTRPRPIRSAGGTGRGVRRTGCRRNYPPQRRANLRCGPARHSSSHAAPTPIEQRKAETRRSGGRRFPLNCGT